MDFNDIFRSFFGVRGPKGFGHGEDDAEGPDFSHSPPPFGFRGGQSGRNDGDDDADEDMTFGGGHGGGWFPPSGGGLFFRFEDDVQDMFSQFEDMFRHFGLNESPSAFSHRAEDDPPMLPPSSSSSSSKSQTPRDEMLKRPDSLTPPASLPSSTHQDGLKPAPDRKPSGELPSWSSLWNSQSKWNFPPSFPRTLHKKDEDLDDQVKGGNLGEILTPKDPSLSPDTGIRQSPSSRSYFRSISVQRVRKPDGTVEERRTETDADGNVTSTVRSSGPGSSATPPALASPDGPPGFQRPGADRDDSLLGEAQTKSIFENLFGSWGRP